jgi:enolase-phosphatase E1
LDIEGTTTPLDFVYHVLFPFARTQARDFLRRNLHSAGVRPDVVDLCREHVADRSRGLAPPPLLEYSSDVDIDSIVAYIHWLMDQDRKSTPLKALQGKIWEAGYRSGELKSQVFSDVPSAFSRWRQQGKKIATFSSGSVLAQKLLFAHTETGDLTPYITAYFDTTTGPKAETDSYGRIAEALERLPGEVVFVSDVVAELDAARSAGMATALAARPGNRPQPPGHTHPLILSFDELFPD